MTLTSIYGMISIIPGQTEKRDVDNDSDRAAVNTNGSGTRGALVVDDEPLIRQLMLTTLEDIGLPLCEASDGIEALRIVREQNPAVMFLDINLPYLGGLEVCRIARQEHFNGVVIVVTADYESEPIAAEVGADMFLLKPFSPRDLLCILNSFIPIPRLPKLGARTCPPS